MNIKIEQKINNTIDRLVGWFYIRKDQELMLKSEKKLIRCNKLCVWVLDGRWHIILTMAANRVRVSNAIVGRCWRHCSTRPHPSIDRIVRVDHAGEFGADRIYAGQMAVLGNTASGPIVKVGL